MPLMLSARVLPNFPGQRIPGLLREATTLWICDSGIRLNAVESALASVAVGAMTLSVL